MKDIYELINKELLIREPVDDICDKLIASQDNKIILTGGRGVGKTVVLSNLENRSLGTKNNCICMRFESVGFGSHFDETFFTHYYELIFSRNLLYYINTNYTLTYNRYFEKYNKIISDYLKEVDNYVNNYLYNNVSIKKYLIAGELSKEILNKFKEVLEIETLTLAIDRFDWTLNRNAIAQKVLSEYFNMFDKIIITTDDETLKEKDGYSVINVEYGKDIEVIKEIIKKYVISYDSGKSGYEQLPVDLITNETYSNLIERTNGNIKLMLEILKEVIICWEWDCKDFDIQENFDKETTYKVKRHNEVEKIGVKPQLHL